MPSAVVDVIRINMMIDWRITGKIVRTVLSYAAFCMIFVHNETHI